MTANCVDYQKLTNKLFYGCPLSDEHMNSSILQLVKYLRDGGAAHIAERLDICLVFHECGGSVRRVRMCYKKTGKELSINEMENIGLFLRGGYC